ncbi:SIS domain-containing protein [Enterobacter hormaechei]|uniref:SIS domain-containing protein n=1 Tax=Enterobacter hormaechei TaxID=158836 RepID=UPI003F55B560
MNSAEFLDSRTSVMPLSATRKEVGDITEYIRRFDFLEAINVVSDMINANKIRNIILLGSGDSYALALIYSALMNQITCLPVRAIQSWEFICEKSDYLDESWLVIVLSASGRQSPVVDSLIKAQTSKAQVIGITNNEESIFALLAKMRISTGVTKAGMPTLSNVSTALWLDAIGGVLSSSYQISMKNEHDQLKTAVDFLPDIASFKWCQELVNLFFTHRITVLGSGGDYGLASMISNLLWCGPQIPNQVMQLEEYAHALRLNQASENDLIIIFDCTGNSGLMEKKIIHLLSTGGSSVKYIDYESLGLIMGGNASYFQQNDNCRYYAMMLIFSLIISATEKYLAGGGRRVYVESRDEEV